MSNNRDSDRLDTDAFEIVPLVGTGCIRLGDSDEEVKRKLFANQIAFDDSSDPYRWEIEKPYCSLTFEAGSTNRLVQIDFLDSLGLIKGRSVVGVMLDEALLDLGVRSVDDTLWSIVDIDAEYSNGVAISDKKRPTKCDVKTLLDGGTL